MSTHNWRDHAECRNRDPEIWFPASDTGGAHRRQVAKAKAICRACPVRDACLDFALTALPYGIAGGLTADERRQMRAVQDGRVNA